MKLQTREEAHKLPIYFAVCDPFGSKCYPVRFSTEKEAWAEKRGACIGGDLDVVRVDVANQTTERLNQPTNWVFSLAE